MKQSITKKARNIKNSGTRKSHTITNFSGVYINNASVKRVILDRATQNELTIKPFFFCAFYFLDTEANTTFKTKSKKSQVKLFKPPVVRKTISIISRKRFYQRELVSLSSQIKMNEECGPPGFSERPEMYIMGTGYGQCLRSIPAVLHTCVMVALGVGSNRCHQCVERNPFLDRFEPVPEPPLHMCAACHANSTLFQFAIVFSGSLTLGV